MVHNSIYLEIEIKIPKLRRDVLENNV